MSDALALPPRPNIEQYKKLAKDFQEACKTGDSSAVRNWSRRWAENVARLQGLPDTPEVRERIASDGERIERQWRRLRKSNEHAEGCTLAGAQLLIARCLGFDSWPKFAQHLVALGRAHSPESQFEAAADAIAGGDIETLRGLLRENPELARTRSTREHRSTLLHYVSANGIEDFRQKRLEILSRSPSCCWTRAPTSTRNRRRMADDRPLWDSRPRVATRKPPAFNCRCSIC